MDDFMIEQESRDSDASSSSDEYISDSYDTDYPGRSSKLRALGNSAIHSDPSMSSSSSDGITFANDPEAKIQ